MVIVDTNVILSGLKSRNGPSFTILKNILDNDIRIAISVPLILEYEAVLKRELDRNIFTDQDIDVFLNYICRVGLSVKIFYLWRPFLKDPYDDHILEVAIAAHCTYIITYNKKNFLKTGEMGIHALTPYEYLALKGGKR